MELTEEEAIFENILSCWLSGDLTDSARNLSILGTIPVRKRQSAILAWRENINNQAALREAQILLQKRIPKVERLHPIFHIVRTIDLSKFVIIGCLESRSNMALLGDIFKYAGSSSILDREANILKRTNPQRFRMGKSRMYLDDYAGFSTVFSVKNIVMQITKGACLPLIAVTKEMEVHNNKQIEGAKEGKPMKEFDLAGSMARQWGTFVSSTQRFYCTSVIRRGYDLCLMLNFSPKFVDHLCKDMTRSAIRKLNKLGRTQGSLHMFRTSILGGFLNYFSSFTYDILLASSEFLSSKEKKLNFLSALRWLYKRSVYYSVLLVSTSAGFSFGTLIGDRGQVLSTIFALLAEVLAGEAANKYLL